MFRNQYKFSLPIEVLPFDMCINKYIINFQNKLNKLFLGVIGIPTASSL